MRYCRIIIFIWVLMGINPIYAAPDPVSQPQFLTLQDAIWLGLRYNPEVRNAEIARVLDKFNLRLAQNQFEVQYALTGKANFTDTVSSGNRSGSYSASLTPSASINTTWGGNISVTSNNPLSHPVTGDGRTTYNPGVTITATQPLLQGFGPDITLIPLHNAWDAEYIARLNLKDTVIGTITTIIKLYAAVVQAQTTLTTQQAALEAAQATLKKYQALVKVGRNAPADLVQFEGTVASSQLNIQQAEISLQQAQLTLLNTLGLDPNMPLAPLTKLTMPSRKIPTLAESVEIALQHNIGYQQALIGMRKTRRAVRSAEDQQRWQLNLTVSQVQGGGNGGNTNAGLKSITNEKNHITTVGLALTVPIDNLSVKGKLVSAKVALQQAEINLAAKKRGLIQQVTSGYYTVLNAQQQLGKSQEVIDRAADSLRIAQKKLEFGRTTPFEVNTLQNNLTTAQVAYIGTENNYITSIASFDQLLGVTLDRWSVRLAY